MTGRHERRLSPRARRRRLISAFIDTLIATIALLIILYGIMALLGCAAAAFSDLIRV
jgi:hypothetical protein